MAKSIIETFPILLGIAGTAVIYGIWFNKWREGNTHWEPILVAVLEVATVLYALERVDVWVHLLLEGVAK